MSAVIVALMQHSWTSIRHTSWKDLEGNKWSFKTGGVGTDDWGFWQAFRESIVRHLWEKAARHELGTDLKGGADLTTLFKHDKFLEKGASMQPEECFWQRLQHRDGRRSYVIVQGWWSRRSSRDARKWARICTIEFGYTVQTQVKSLTRHSNSVTKPLKPRTHWNVSGSERL